MEASFTHHDYDGLPTISKEIDELWSALNEMMTRGEMLNNRQNIFNQPEIDMERLAVFVKRLQPHHTLWTMASNFLRSKDHWSFFPLSSVDINAVEAEVNRCRNVLQDSRVHFASNAEMMVLIEKISRDVDGFGDAIDVMRALKNPDFHEEQWKLLSKRSGIPFELTSETTFKSLLARGIVKFMNIVKQISLDATREREAKILEEIETERKRREDKEIMKQKKARRAARKDI